MTSRHGKAHLYDLRHTQNHQSWHGSQLVSTVVETKISQQPLEGLPWNFVQTFMGPSWCIIMTLMIPNFSSSVQMSNILVAKVEICGSKWNVSTTFGLIEIKFLQAFLSPEKFFYKPPLFCDLPFCHPNHTVPYHLHNLWKDRDDIWVVILNV